MIDEERKYIYICDGCGKRQESNIANDIPIGWFQLGMELTKRKSGVMEIVLGDRHIGVAIVSHKEEHYCSKKCLVEALQKVIKKV